METALCIDAVERATILAALRYYQQQGQGDPSNRSDEIHDIATDVGNQISLDEEGIDVLCEKVNFGEAPLICIGIQGGVVTGVSSTAEVLFVVLDYDTEGASDEETMAIPSLDGSGQTKVLKRVIEAAKVEIDSVHEIGSAVGRLMCEME